MKRKEKLSYLHKYGLPPSPSGLPPGLILTEEILNAEKPALPPPATIHYTEKHVSQHTKSSSAIQPPSSSLTQPPSSVKIPPHSFNIPPLLITNLPPPHSLILTQLLLLPLPHSLIPPPPSLTQPPLASTSK